MKFTKQKIILIIIVILFIIALGPYTFYADQKPPIEQTWKVGSSWKGIQLISISADPLKAIFEYEETVFYVIEDEWITISNQTFKIRIYPEKNYVWVIWK